MNELRWGAGLVLLLPIAIGAAAALGAVAGTPLLLVIGIGLASPAVMMLAVRPELATLAVVFILYTNAAAIGVAFHGVPYLVGAALPALLLVPVAYHLVVKRERVVCDAVIPLIVLFLLMQLLATFFSEETGRSLGVLAECAVEGLGLYFLLINAVRTKETLRRVIWVLLAAGALLGGLSLFQYVTKTYHTDYGGFAQVSNTEFETGGDPTAAGAGQPRLAGPIGGQNRYAQIMLMLVPLGLFRFWGERSPRWRLLAGMATAVTASALVLSFSRGAAVGFVLMLVTMVWMRSITLSQCGVLLLGASLFLVAVPQYMTRLSTLGRLCDAVQSEGEGIAAADSSARSRYVETVAAGLMFLDHPVTGVGPGMYPRYYHEYAGEVGIEMKATARQPHTLYLGIAAELGAPGLIAFLLIVYVALRNLLYARGECAGRDPEHAAVVTGFILSIVSYLATGLFLHFAYIRYFWLMMALAGAASRLAMDRTLTPVSTGHA